MIRHIFRMVLNEVFTKHEFIDENNIDADPIKQFAKWYNDAIRTRVTFYDAMTLATATRDGKPSARVVLLKAYDDRGFVFYSNDDSRKGFELIENPNAALTFYWNKKGRQIRIEGRVEQITDAESDKYFASRVRGSQIGAWASHQSSVIADRKTLEVKVGQIEKKYAGQTVPRPPYWIGYRVIPHHIEFWENRINRLHDRFLYTLSEDKKWSHARLSP